MGQRETECYGCGQEFTDSGLKTIETARDESIRSEREIGPRGQEESEAVCPVCGRPVALEDSFCLHCGVEFEDETEERAGDVAEESEELDVTCPICGHKVTLIDAYCPHCGIEFEEQEVEGVIDEAVERIEVESEEVARPTLSKPALHRTPDSGEPRASRAKGRINGFVNGLRQPSGTVGRGRVNGFTNGYTNGYTNGLVNGVRQKSLSGRAAILGKRWKLTTAVVVVILVAANVGFFLLMGTGQPDLRIDGEFSEWTDIPAYDYSASMSALDLDVDVAKMAHTSTMLHLYLKTSQDIFSSENPSGIYFFIDSDRDPDTGYAVEGDFGADQMIVVDGWDGITRGAVLNKFDTGADDNNWSGWYPSTGVRFAQTGEEIELNCRMPSEDPQIKLVRRYGEMECSSPIMSFNGTIIALMTSAPGETAPVTSTQSLMTVSMMAMGVKISGLVVEPSIVSTAGDEIQLNSIEISSDGWTDMEVSAGLLSLPPGSSFSYSLMISSGGFTGACEAIECTSDGYYESLPGRIIVDGIICDWAGLETIDSDLIAKINENIDIAEYGATTQEGEHLFFVEVEGKPLGGSNVPEHRTKPVPSGNETPSIIRLRKTGEDLLQAYIDVDPANSTGRLISTGDKWICADYLVEIIGRHRQVTEAIVYEWSGSGGGASWDAIGQPGEIAVGRSGIEFSIAKTLLGNMTSSEIIFAMTDWQRSSDLSHFVPMMGDPWVMVLTGTDYRTGDGSSWSSGGSITLESGDSIVDIAVCVERGTVYTITNSGRAYNWEVGVSTSWTTWVSSTVNGTANIVAIAPNGLGVSKGAYILASDGRSWEYDSGSWSYKGKVADGITDFVDFFYQNTGKRTYAIRSGADTPAYYAASSNWNFQETHSTTGSTSTQSHFIFTGSTQQNNEDIYVLCEDGEIMYSSNGGTTWATRGDLPEPGTGDTPAGSKYIGIDRDDQGDVWVITDTGHCYKSTDDADSFTFTGKTPAGNVAAITTPIPEFSEIALPIIATTLCVMFLRSGRMKRT